MSVINALILGIIQGLTEFLPVSSSAHLGLIPALANWEEQNISFDIMLHTASLLALIVYFRKELKNILLGFFNKENPEFSQKESKSLILNIFLALIPLVPFYIFFKSFVESSQSFSNITVILLMVFGLILIIVDRFKQKNTLTIKGLKIPQALIIGASQCLALFSGVSRSGITITSGLLTGLKESDAKKFTFFLSIPTIGAGFLMALKDVITGESQLVLSLSLLIAMLATFFSGLLALELLFRFGSKIKLTYYGIYRIILGIILLIFIF